MNRQWHCEKVKNVTVSLSDEVYRRARMLAAERGTSLSALVREFLETLGSGESRSETLRKAEASLRARITEFRASDRLPRDELHGRKR